MNAARASYHRLGIDGRRAAQACVREHTFSTAGTSMSVSTLSAIAMSGSTSGTFPRGDAAAERTSGAKAAMRCASRPCGFGVDWRRGRHVEVRGDQRRLGAAAFVGRK